ncbi:hypothetical protein Tco_1350069, partial [Tanacetum coccineum]
ESSAPKTSTIIRIPRRRQPDPETPILTVVEIDVTNLDEATQMSIAIARSLEDLEAQQNVKKVKEHLVDEEIEQIVKGNDDVDKNQFVDDILNRQEDPDTEIEPGSHKERPEVEKRYTPTTTPRSSRTHTDSLSSDKEELEELTASEPLSSSPKPKTKRSKFFKDILARMSRRYGYMFCHMRQSFMPKKDMEAISNVVHATLKKVVPPMVDKTTNDIVKKNLSKVVAEAIRLERQKVKDDIAAIVVDAVQNERESIRAELSMQVTNDVANVVPLQMKDDKQARDVDLTIWLALKYKYEKIVPHIKPCRVTAVRARDYEDHHDDARPKGESSAKRQKTSEHGTYTRGESLSSQAMDELTPSGSSTQEHLEDFDAWQDNQGIDDDESYMESQIVWESKEEETLKIPKKLTPVFQSCVRNPKIPPMSLVNQDLFYLKNENSETRKYVPSLHKIHAISFSKNDLEELNTRWVKKIIKRFDLYARYAIDHWKNPWAQQAHIRRKLKTRDVTPLKYVAAE